MLKKIMHLRPDLRLAVAESLTGGHVQARITAESGSSDYFVGGLTAYTIDQKVALLGVDRASASACNCVSSLIARQMARGVCKLMKCNVGVSTTGYAEPDPANGVTIPNAYWTICHQEGRRQGFIDGYGEFPGLDRLAVQERTAEAVLGTLTRYLESLPESR